MFRMRRHTQVILMRVIAIFMFIVTVTVSTIAIYASVPSSDYGEEQGTDEESDQNKDKESDGDALWEDVSDSVEISDVSPAVDPVENPTNDGTPDETPDETPKETPGEMPDATPDETLNETPEETPSETPDETPSASPSATPDVSPSASPSATPSATPDAADEENASIWYGSEGISGTGLDEVTVSFDTSELNEEDTFGLILSVDTEDVTSNYSFTSSGDGYYEISGLSKDVGNITFGNLNGEEFSISAKGDTAAFNYYASGEVKKTEAGYIGTAEIRAVSEETELEEIEIEEQKLTEQKIIVKTDDGAWITVSGLLPDGARVNAVPVSVEIEGKVVLAAYDITILDVNDAEYQITEAVTVSITSPALLAAKKEANNDRVSVYHLEDPDSSAEKVADVKIDYNKVSFEAEGFSTYALTRDEILELAGVSDAICINDPDNGATWLVKVTDPETLEGVGRQTVFTFRLTYSFDNTEVKPTKDNNVAYFIIPSELVQLTTSSGVEGPIYNADNNNIGSYKLVGNYVFFTYDETWLSNNNNNVEGYFEFKAEIDSSYTENKDEVTISFTGRSNDITIKFDDGGVTAYKNFELLSDGTIEFTISFDVEGKNAENVELKDILGAVFSFIPDTFYLDDTKVEATIDGQEAVINIPNLAIGKHVLKYRATIVGDVWTADSNEKNNTVYYDWETNPSDNPGSFTCGVWFTQESIEKSGVQEKDRIKWTITVRPDSLSNVIGQTVTDALGSGQTYEGTFNVYKGYSWEWGNSPVATETISDGATGFTYEFTEANIGNAELGQVYTIEYYTIPDTIDEDGTYTNTLNGKEYSVEYKEEYSGTVVDIVSKNGSASNYPDSTITWTITVDPTRYADGQTITDLVLHDQLLNAGTTGSVYDKTSLSVQYDNGTALTANDYTITWNETDFTIMFADSAVDMAKRIVVSYTTKLAEGSSGGVEKNRVETSYNLDGKSKTEVDEKEIEYAKQATKPFEKTGVLNGNEVEWTIVANKDPIRGDSCKSGLEGSYVISDQLPEGMEYIENSARYELRHEGLYGEGAIEPTVDGDGKLTFAFSETFSYFNSDYNNGFVYIVLTFKTRITTIPESGSVSFVNHAQLFENGEEIGDASAEVTIENTALDKTGVLNETDLNTVNYTIIVNRAGADLNPYSDVLTLVDILDPNTTLDLGSVSVTELSTGKAVDYTFSYDSTGGQDKFALELPDEMTLKVAYEVVVAGEKNTTVTIRNSAELSGVANASTTEENQVTIQASAAGANADSGSITISKYDGDTLQPISGAVFSLYKLNQENGTGNYMMDSVTDVAVSQKVGANGKLTFSGLDADAVYYYVEDSAPTGYVLDTEKHYFILQGNSYASALAKMSDELKNVINKWPGGKSVNVFNSPIKIDISGTKTWDDSENQDGIRPNSIMVHLLKNNTDVVESTLVTASNGWQYTFKDLPEYENGQKITYTVTEEPVDGYDASYNGYDITNTHRPETVNISGTKVWDDNSDQDGKRPDSIEVKLYADNELKESKTVSGTGDTWSWSFTGLDKYQNGRKIVYTVTEEQVTGYEEPVITENAANGFTITNKHTPETIDIKGTKVWKDNGALDSDRPSEITIKLYKNGGAEAFMSTTASAANDWSWSFTGLDKYEAGREITYTVREDVVANYSTEITKEETGSYIITNTHTPGETSRTVQKVWDDSDNQDGIRPDSITVQLMADNESYGDPVTLNEENAWTYTWDKLPERENGKTVAYTVQEIGKIEGYTTTYSSDSFIITNAHTPEPIDISGVKKWNDNSDQDGKRPSSITINLYKTLEGGSKELVRSKSVNGTGDSWSWSFENLPKYDHGTKIVYTVEEEQVEGYKEPEITGNAEGGFEITNTHAPETISISGSKTWLDDGEADRPESITINLYKKSSDVAVKTVTVTQAEDWKWSFTDLAKYENGTVIEYYITEDLLTDYSAKITGNAENGFVVTNTHTPGETARTVMKVWEDENNQDGLRPGSITVQLLADGNEYGAPVTLSESNVWKATWEKLPERGADGKTISYTVKEIGTIAGYETSYNYKKDESTFVITNTHTPETISINGTKEWVDNSNQDGKRPTSITVELYADDSATAIASTEVTGNEGSNSWSWSFTGLPKYRDKGTEINYTVKEIVDEDTAKAYTSEIKGYTITNTHSPDKTEVEGSKTWLDDGEGDRPTSITIKLYANGTFKDSKVVTAAEDWKWSFTNLDKYANGSEITYTIEEEAVANYSSEINGYDVTNTHTPGETSITVQKVWNDNNDQDGKRPDSIKVQLYANGDASGEPVTLSGAGNTWTHTWTGLPARENGRTIAYTVGEIGTVTGYTTTYSDDTYTITNTHTPETTSISGTKTWNDSNNQDGKRPGSITINLLADNDVVRSQNVTPDNNGIWSYSFTDLPVYEDGSAIVYSIEEVITDPVADAAYTSEVSGYDVKNTHTPEETKITVKKVWEDQDNQDGKRPAEVVVALLANGTATGTTVTLSEDNGWMHTFTGLPKYENRSEISYSVSEGTVTDYSSDIKKTESEAEGVVYTITNSYTPGKTNISVEKRWSDNNNQDGKRPTEIQVQLKADNEDHGSPVILNDANNWSYTWTELDQMADGVTINYTVQEINVPDGYDVGYEVNGSKTTITNTHTPATIDISGTKTWSDNDNQDGKRPASITIKLLKDGAEYKSQTVTADADGNWNYSFTGLPEYADGKAISYSIQEVTNATAAGYTSTVKGYDVTNTYSPEKAEVSVQKVWEDADDQDGKRPASLEVTLLADGAEKETVTLNDDNDWKYTFTNLDKYRDGNLISYTVSEETVDSYSAVITGNAMSGYTITNSYTPAKTSISVEKIWDDANDQDGKRPASIQVQLYADDTAKGAPITLDSTNNWRYTWNELAQKSGGNDIRYEVKEVSVPAGYTANSTVSGIKTTITNSYSPATTSVSVNKEWNDANNQDGKRPASITIKLLKDGAEYKSQVVEADASGNWSYTFENLPKYRDKGTKIVYTVQEVKVEGYNDPVVTGNAANGFTITNTRAPETVAVEGTKTWVDNNNEAGARPASITINLLADGEKIDSQTIKPDANGNWPSWKFENLPKYAAGSVGQEIEYTISEGDITDYTAKVEGYNVTNTYTPETTMVTVTKKWVDNEDAEGLRPEAIWVQLYKDKLFDKAVGDPVRLSAENGWSYTWNDLPKRGFLLTINYTVKELGVEDADGNYAAVTGYTSATSETTTNNIVITNTLTTTPTPTPGETPAPTGTPDATPDTTPEATPDVTPGTTPDVTPSATPGATPEATPNATPEATPNTTPTIDRTPAPTATPTREVLGALRVKDKNVAVLGARRGLDYAVLGKRRRPSTGDSTAMLWWILTLGLASGTALTSAMLLRLKKKE